MTISGRSVAVPDGAATTPSGLSVRIFRVEAPVRVLGPGARAAIWVQGCGFHCAGCIVPESWDFAGGREEKVSILAEWVLSQSEIEGVTLSGGEPMSQAAALCELIDRVRARCDLGVVCYTGFTLDRIRDHGDSPQKALLSRIDLLIDGVYRKDLHESLLWRGSSNQRLNLLTPRYKEAVSAAPAERGDSSAGVEITMDGDGSIGFVGVPEQAGFREEFLERMRARGVRLDFGEV